MSQVEVMYSVPVAVTVDLELGEVVRVRVWDECIEGPTAQWAGSSDEAMVRVAAADIAQEADWPAWEVG